MFANNRIPKLVIIPDELERKFLKSNLKSCWACNSNLMYSEEVYGIVRENDSYMVLGNKSKTTYQLRVVQVNLFCAECGAFMEDYFRVYNKDEVVYYFDSDLDEDEKVEIEYCLNQFNQKNDFEPRWGLAELSTIKEKLLADLKLHPDL